LQRRARRLRGVDRTPGVARSMTVGGATVLHDPGREPGARERLRSTLRQCHESGRQGRSNRHRTRWPRTDDPRHALVSVSRARLARSRPHRQATHTGHRGSRRALPPCSHPHGQSRTRDADTESADPRAGGFRRCGHSAGDSSLPISRRPRCSRGPAAPWQAALCAAGTRLRSPPRPHPAPRRE